MKKCSHTVIIIVKAQLLRVMDWTCHDSWCLSSAEYVSGIVLGAFCTFPLIPQQPYRIRDHLHAIRMPNQTVVFYFLQ